jgi:hypothetical protein
LQIQTNEDTGEDGDGDGDGDGDVPGVQKIITAIAVKNYIVD